MRTRIGWASAVAVLGLALTLALAGAQGAIATQGQPVIAGATNTESSDTLFQITDPGAPTCSSGNIIGVQGCGWTGVLGKGSTFGVEGEGPIAVYGLGGTTGVRGQGSQTGVYGDGANGIQGVGTENGVLAKGGTFGVFATGDDYGVYASAPNYGIYGDSQDGTGVTASSQNGTALNVQGKIVSKRSGIVTLAASAGVPSVSVTLMNMTPATFIVATVQGNVAGVWVRSVGISPPTNTFKIYLNKVPTTDVRIGWFAMR